MPSIHTDLTAVELVAELHHREAEICAGGPLDPVAELLGQDVTWHVGGHSPISGHHRSIDQVLAHFDRCRRIAQNTIRITPGDVRSEGGVDDPVIQLIEGSAEVNGTGVTWTTVGIYSVDLDRQWVREAWIHPLDGRDFDRIWAGRPLAPRTFKR